MARLSSDLQKGGHGSEPWANIRNYKNMALLSIACCTGTEVETTQGQWNSVSPKKYFPCQVNGCGLIGVDGPSTVNPLFAEHLLLARLRARL